MKTISMFLFAVLLPGAFAHAEWVNEKAPLQSPRVKAAICQAITSQYEVTEAQCERGQFSVTRKFVVPNSRGIKVNTLLDAKAQIGNFSCHAVVRRTLAHQRVNVAGQIINVKEGWEPGSPGFARGARSTELSSSLSRS